MPSFRTGKVLRLLEQRTGLQRVEVDLGDGPERAYVLTQLTGDVAAADPVLFQAAAAAGILALDRSAGPGCGP